MTLWRMLALPPPVGSYKGPTSEVRRYGYLRQRYVCLDDGAEYFLFQKPGLQRWVRREEYA